MPTVVELHTQPEYIHRWVHYATFDAEVTGYLYHTLRKMMESLPVDFEGLTNTFELYSRYWLVFGEVLTNIERAGIQVDSGHLLVA